MLTRDEKLILKTYLNCSTPKLLLHKFELENDYLAGYVTRFLHGKRFKIEFTPFEEYELEVINPLIEENKDNDGGKELTTFVALVTTVCNILNKYKK